MYDLEAMKKKKQEIEERAAMGGGPFWTPPVGRSLIRILPNWRPDVTTWFFEFWSHWIQQAQRGSLCMEIHHTEEMKQEALRLSRPICYCCAMQKITKGLKARPRYLTNIVDLQHPEEGVQVFNIGNTLLNDLLTLFFDPGWGDFTDTTKGYNIILTRIGTGKETEYTLMPERNASPIADHTWLQKLNQLETILNLDSYEEQVQLLSGRTAPTAPLQPTTQLSNYQASLQPQTALGANQQYVAAPQVNTAAPPTKPPCYGQYGHPTQGYACGTCPMMLNCDAESPATIGNSPLVPNTLQGVNPVAQVSTAPPQQVQPQATQQLEPLVNVAPPQQVLQQPVHQQPVQQQFVQQPLQQPTRAPANIAVAPPPPQ